MQTNATVTQLTQETALGRGNDELISRTVPLNYGAMLREMRGFMGSVGYYLRDRDGVALQKQLRDTLIKSSFAYHYENNKFFRTFCLEQNADLETVLASELEKIPAIPIQLFKDQRHANLLLTKGLGEIEFELRSTGTSGIPSVSRRDSDTVDNALLGISEYYREFFSICNGCGLFLCPSPAELPEMGMVKVLNMLSGMFDDRVYLVNRYQFSSKEALDTLASWQDRFARHIVGPPFLINRLLQYMKNKDIRIKLDKTSKIIMLGGWKRFTGEQLSPQNLRELCHDHLGLEAGQVRDMYGLVECNMLAIECEHGHKHVPPWVRVVLRKTTDPTVVVRELREPGIVTVFDPTSMAYPCFVQTEDVGMLTQDGLCKCGRTSQTLEFIRRISGAELGCCAINLDRFLEDGEISRECKL